MLHLQQFFFRLQAEEHWFIDGDNTEIYANFDVYYNTFELLHNRLDVYVRD